MIKGWVLRVLLVLLPCGSGLHFSLDLSHCTGSNRLPIRGCELRIEKRRRRHWWGLHWVSVWSPMRDRTSSSGWGDGRRRWGHCYWPVSRVWLVDLLWAVEAKKWRSRLALPKFVYYSTSQRGQWTWPNRHDIDIRRIFLAHIDVLQRTTKYFVAPSVSDENASKNRIWGGIKRRMQYLYPWGF